MDTMENDNLKLRNSLSDFISDDENEEFGCLDTIRSDVNFNGLHEEYSTAAGFHHSQFSDPPVSSHPKFAGSFSDTISYTDIDWSFDSSRLGLSSQNWSHSMFTNPENKTNTSFHVRNPELSSICRFPLRSQEAEGLDLIGCDRDANNHNLQSSKCEDQIDLNIAAICSGFQTHCLQEHDAETFNVGYHTNPTTSLNRTDKISGYKDNSGNIPNLTTFPQNSVGLRCSNLINFSLHPSSAFQQSIIVGGDNPFPRPSNDDGWSADVMKCNEDILKSLRSAAPSTTESINSQIGISSRSWFTDLESCLHRRDQSQQPIEETDVRNFSSEFPTYAPSLGISATISVPDQSFEHDQSGPSQPPQNFGDSLTTGNQDAREFGTAEDSGIAKSFQAHLAKVSQPIIDESIPLVSSKFEDQRDRSFERSKSSRYIKCRELDQTPKLSGQRCYLCKRDLSFKPEGSVAIPKILPTVAVLPCSHVFHGLCLERITPQNQAEEPPCIPCAVGET
ncbi:uncharacterized protein E5676_scaffold459G001450 [Cucumis melo var. makuwa]|uniref:RING-type domain-containing protein n=1 Tax=Cucumis melo var. makuwa TaxID=1194695 RepID=A0A5D3CG54_CUCMM|nr:uncharacterized protein E5676_scaffold459G001450 [Cucumis melo var. makuwa]